MATGKDDPHKPRAREPGDRRSNVIHFRPPRRGKAPTVPGVDLTQAMFDLLDTGAFGEVLDMPTDGEAGTLVDDAPLGEAPTLQGQAPSLRRGWRGQAPGFDDERSPPRVPTEPPETGALVSPSQPEPVHADTESGWGPRGYGHPPIGPDPYASTDVVEMRGMPPADAEGARHAAGHVARARAGATEDRDEALPEDPTWVGEPPESPGRPARAQAPAPPSDGRRQGRSPAQARQPEPGGRRARGAHPVRQVTHTYGSSAGRPSAGRQPNELVSEPSTETEARPLGGRGRSTPEGELPTAHVQVQDLRDSRGRPLQRPPEADIFKDLDRAAPPYGVDGLGEGRDGRSDRERRRAVDAIPEAVQADLMAFVQQYAKDVEGQRELMRVLRRVRRRGAKLFLFKPPAKQAPAADLLDLIGSFGAVVMVLPQALALTAGDPSPGSQTPAGDTASRLDAGGRSQLADNDTVVDDPMAPFRDS